MAANKELQIIQREKLYDLLTLKVENHGTNIKGLEKMIKRVVATMSEEDVAWVEKMISQDQA